MAKSKPSAGTPGEDNCREALISLAGEAADDETFKRVRRVIARLPARIDPDAVFQALADGLITRELVLDPRWCRKRDQALARVGRAIDDLRHVMGPPPGVAPIPPSVWPDVTAGLEREHRKLREDPFMTASRTSEGGTRRAGRPEAVWRRETDEALRTLGVSKRSDREALLKAAGLIAPHLIDDLGR